MAPSSIHHGDRAERGMMQFAFHSIVSGNYEQFRKRIRKTDSWSEKSKELYLKISSAD
jgi:hypothetical protein